MTYFFITDQNTIYDALIEKNLKCYLLTSEFTVGFDSPGLVIKTININGINHDICLTETNGKCAKDIDNQISKLENVCMVNSSGPQESSQFNFDMMLTQLNEKSKIAEVKRLWINDVNELKTLNVTNSSVLIENSDLKNISQFYLTKSLLDYYWKHSKLTSINEIKLTLQDYYVMTLLAQQEEEIAESTQSAYFTVKVSHEGIEGKLFNYQKYKFPTFEQANTAINKSTTFMVVKSKYNETHVAKPMLFNISSLIKISRKFENIESILKSLYDRGFISNPYTKNHTLPSSIVSSLINNMENYGNRYNHVISHIKAYGLTQNHLDKHIKDNYVNDQVYSVDRSHAILPLPSNSISTLTESELYIYDLIVLRYFTIFMPNSVKYSKKIEAIGNNNMKLKFERTGDLLFGCSVFESTINKIFYETDANTIRIRNLLPVGSVINIDSLNAEVKGNVSNLSKELNELQLINKLNNMGRKMIPRKLKLRYRNFSIGDATTWHKKIEYLEEHGIISRNDDNTFSIYQHGKKLLEKTKAYLINIDNLNNLHVDLVKILSNERNIYEVLINHISLLKSLENSPNFSFSKPPNYKKIITNYKCRCGHTLRLFDNFIGCSDYPNCKISISKTIQSKDSYTLTELDFVELLSNGETSSLIEQFQFKSGVKSNILLTLSDSGKVTYKFINKKL